MQVCTSLQTDNRASIPLLSFLQAGCPSCRPTNSVKALKAPQTQLNTSFYAKPVQKNKLIKTSAAFNTPWRIQREINNGMCCYLTPSIVPAAVNGHIIHIFQVELAM